MGLSWIGKQTKLTMLRLADISLYSDISFSIGNLTKLTLLTLGGNELTGPIPLWPANLTQLNTLWLPYNKLCVVQFQHLFPAF